MRGLFALSYLFGSAGLIFSAFKYNPVVNEGFVIFIVSVFLLGISCGLRMILNDRS